MTVGELLDKLQAGLFDGEITRDTPVEIEDPEFGGFLPHVGGTVTYKAVQLGAWIEEKETK